MSDNIKTGLEALTKAKEDAEQLDNLAARLKAFADKIVVKEMPKQKGWHTITMPRTMGIRSKDRGALLSLHAAFADWCRSKASYYELQAHDICSRALGQKPNGDSQEAAAETTPDSTGSEDQ